VTAGWIKVGAGIVHAVSNSLRRWNFVV